MRHITWSSALVLLLGFSFFTWGFGMPKPPAALADVHGQPQDFSQIHKIFLVGPGFQELGIPHDDWQDEVQGRWQGEVIALWSKSNSMPTLVKAGAEWEGALKDALSKNGAGDVPVFDSKTEEPNPDFQKLQIAAAGEAARTLGADAVLLTAFVLIPARVETNIALWDGRMDMAVKASWMRMLGGGSENWAGHTPAISLALLLVDKQGKLLYEGRAGYSVAAILKVGLAKDKHQEPDYQALFGEGRPLGIMHMTNPKNRAMCIALGLGPLMKAMAGAGQ
jgi:hypothetical protein